ncbi:MAG: zinc-dependent peptidase [Myxococcales bacterium]
MCLAWWRRRRALEQPFSETWRGFLRAQAPFYRTLPASDRARFEDCLKVFLRTKEWTAAGGMALDEAAKVLISAGAARLATNLPGDAYARLGEIVVYPAHYVHEGQDGIVFGEANQWGTVVLSYAAVLSGLANQADGHDTSLHEFAHALDAADGAFDGTPALAKYSAYAPWARVMSGAFLDLEAKGHRRTVLRKYGTTNEAEFFAVATEAFFEKPRSLKDKHPELYEVLAGFYRCDPADEHG